MKIVYQSPCRVRSSPPAVCPPPENVTDRKPPVFLPVMEDHPAETDSPGFSGEPGEPGKPVKSAADQGFVQALSFLPDRVALALADTCRGWTDQVEEIRLHADRFATLTVGGQNVPTAVRLSGDELVRILLRLCDGSLYAYAQQINRGFVTVGNGVRVGVVGHAACEDRRIIGVSQLTGLCIRLPHTHICAGEPVSRLIRRFAAMGRAEGALIYAPPGEGKTTLLRCIARHMAGGERPWRVVILDTRGEFNFALEEPDLCLDVLSGYPRAEGISIATRSLNAQLILCDEIGEAGEVAAFTAAHRGGVPIVATAHAGSLRELLDRPVFRHLRAEHIFGAYVGIRRDGQGDFTYRVTDREEAGFVGESQP